MSDFLLETRGVKKYFKIKNRQVLKAVDGIDISVGHGQTLGLVGESGCGKSTLGRILTRIYTPSAGTVLYRGRDIFNMKRAESMAVSREIQMIFQNPYTSLNPRMTVTDIVGEAIDIHALAHGRNKTRRIRECLMLTGLNPSHAAGYIHSFSGGERQRIGIARALAAEPSFIICDEPVSALDVSTRAQILNLLKRLREELSLSYLFIGHDLTVVRYICDRIAVMYLGKIVELTGSSELFNNPAHPYTKALLSAIPAADPWVERERKRIVLKEDPFGNIKPPDGCRFSARCLYVQKRCFTEEPDLREVSTGHLAACHLLTSS